MSTLPVKLFTQDVILFNTFFNFHKCISLYKKESVFGLASCSLYFKSGILLCGAVIVSSWIAADFGSGVFHWSVDNYGNGRTPVMGNIIAAFQGHHSAPWTITYRGFCNIVWKLCIPFGLPTVAAINYLAGDNSMGE